MSEIQGFQNSVLLPTAKISLFVIDNDLKDAALSLKEDWRFARVTIDVVEADVDAAIELYAHGASPDIVMVETADIGDAFAGKLETLSGNCSENTAAVVVGPVNDVYLYRKLIDMGVSDYLVKPLNRDVMAQVFSKILQERLGSSGSRLIACVGAKGGVGTSTIANVVAQVSANQLHQKTIILDAAGGWSYLAVAMGGDAVTTLHEVARASASTDKDSFNRMMVAVNDKLTFLGTGAESLLDDSISAESYEGIINRLMQIYPVVVVDVSSAPIPLRRTVMALANDVLIVSTPTLPALRTARGLLQETRTLRGGTDEGLHIVLNMKGMASGYEVSESDMAVAIKVKPAVVISYLPKVIAAAEGQGKAVSAVAGGADIVSMIQNFLQTKLGFASEKSGIPTTDKSNFINDLMGKIKLK